MDRRRFVPASEGLEQRALLLTTTTPNLANIFGFQVSTNLNVPITFEQKELRVEHLPYYLGKIRPGRFLPEAELKEIKSDLFQFISQLHKPATAALNNFNYGLRPLFSKQSITAAEVNTLNNNFGSVLTAATASPSVVQQPEIRRVPARDPGRHRQPATGLPGDQRLFAHPPDRAIDRPADAVADHPQDRQESGDPGRD